MRSRLHRDAVRVCVPTSVIALVTLFAAGPGRAETKLMQETEGKEASLALLKQQMKDSAGKFCGAKRSKLVVRVDDLGGIATTTKGRRDIEEERVLETAQSLGSNQSVTVLYCEGRGDDLVATGTTVTHVVWEKKSGWTASVVRSGKSLAAAKQSDADKLSDAEVAKVLAEASREINKSLPMIVDKGLRLDSSVGANKVLLYSYTLVDHKASAVNADEFRRGMTAKIIPSVCEDEEMQFLLKNGVRYRYRYHGEDGTEIATITMGSSDCK